MTNPNYTAICLVVDRSGSMFSIQEAAEEGINGFIADQGNADGYRTIRIVEFDHEYNVVQSSTNARLSNPYFMSPRGTTALLDAMGRAMTEFGEELASLDEHDRPGNVVFAVMTDGHENSSSDYTFARIEEMVTHQRDVYGWNVLYLGANQDAIKVGARLGIKADQSLTYTASSAGTRSAMRSLGETVAVAASGGVSSFTAHDRDAAAK